MKKRLFLILALVMCLTLCACREGTPANTRGSNATTDTTTIPEEEQMQKLIDYNKALDLLDSVNTDFSQDHIEMMNKAYDLLVNLGDYKDAPDLLSRFTECTYKKDTPGDYTIYDNQGICLAKSVDGRKYRCTNTFDEKGRLVRVDFGNKDKPYFCTYEYNDAGQLIQKDIVLEYQSTCYTYKYDTDGNLSTEHCRYQNGYDEPTERITHFTYAFDQMSRVASERKEYDGYYIESTYTYDENGLLIAEDEYASEYRSQCRYTYTYDEHGNLITTETVAEQNGSTRYDETKHTYTSVYFYTPAP